MRSSKETYPADEGSAFSQVNRNPMQGNALRLSRRWWRVIPAGDPPTAQWLVPKTLGTVVPETIEYWISVYRIDNEPLVFLIFIPRIQGPEKTFQDPDENIHFLTTFVRDQLQKIAMPKTRKGNAQGAGSFPGCQADSGIMAPQAAQQGKNMRQNG